MLIGANIGDGNNVMQERLAQTYGRVLQADLTPRIATTDIDSSSGASSDPSWDEALARAMSKSNALMEAQANIQQREADIAQREMQISQREKALQAERHRLQAALLFPALKLA